MTTEFHRTTVLKIDSIVTHAIGILLLDLLLRDLTSTASFSCLGAHNFCPEVDGVVVQIEDPHFPGRLIPGSVKSIIKDQGGVVTLARDCHVMPFAIIHVGPVKVHDPSATTEVKTQLKVAFHNL